MRHQILLPLIVLSTVLGLVLLAPFIAPYDPMTTQPQAQLEMPSQQHILGTDYLGRDVLSRLLFGGQQTILLAFLATSLAVSGGLILGLLASIRTDLMARTVTALIDSSLALPGLVVALVILTVLGRGTLSLAVAVGIAQIPFVARVVRGAVLDVQTSEYLLAAHSLGGGTLHILRHHILRAIQPTVTAYGLITLSYAIINAAGLSLLGLGAVPGTPEWGLMLAEGRSSFRQAPWVAIAPGIMLVLLIISLNRLADAQRHFNHL